MTDAAATLALAGFVGQELRRNALCPDIVDTPSLRGSIDAFDDPVQSEKSLPRTPPEFLLVG